MTYGLDSNGRPATAMEGTTVVIAGVTFGPTGPTVIDIGPGTDQDTYTYSLSRGLMDKFTFYAGTKNLAGTLTWNTNATLGTLGLVDGFYSNNGQSCAFTYDDVTRLVGDNCGPVWSQTYSYDQYNNLNQFGSQPWTSSYNASNNRYTLSGTSYDGNGNLTSDATNTYSYDPFNKMIKSGAGVGTTCGSNANCVTYDGFGQIAEMNTAGSGITEMLFSPIGNIATMSGASTVVSAKLPTPGGGGIVHTSPTTLFYQHKDWLGSVRLSSNVSNGTVYFDRSFAPYGQAYNQNLNSNNITFTGDLQNLFVGLFDTPNREMAQAQGRWTTPDPSQSSWNAYAYGTNPNSETDPSGLKTFPQWYISAAGLSGMGYTFAAAIVESGGGTVTPLTEAGQDSKSSSPGAGSGPRSGSGSVTVTIWYPDDDGNQWFSTDGGRTWDVQLYGLWGSGGYVFGAGNMSQDSGVDYSTSFQIGFVEGDGNQGYIDLNPGAGVSFNQTLDGPTPEQTVLGNVSVTGGTNSVGTSMVQNPDGTISTQGTTFSEGYGVTMLGPWQVQIPLSPSTPQAPSTYDPWIIQTSSGFIDVSPNSCYCLR